MNKELMNDPRLSVVTLRNILQTGLYGCLDNRVKIWVSRDTPSGFFKFSNQENMVSSNELEKWTKAISISDCNSLNRFLKLKAFW